MSETYPAATVIVVRDGDDGLETLLLRRNSKIAFGGMWVFPGGRVDAVDRARVDAADELGAARHAAVREAQEEAGLVLASPALQAVSHWTPPAAAPKRFLTWFFLVRAPGGDVTIDRGEIHDHEWMRPADALARRNAQEIELAPPTWVTLEWLREHSAVAAALAAAAARPPERFETRILLGADGPVALWHGDAAYASDELGTDGPRHRLCMSPAGWRYERS